MGLKKLVGIIAVSIFLSGCLTFTQAITAGQFGLQIAKAVHYAKQKEPENLGKRKEIYAELFCDYQRTQEVKLEWANVSKVAQDNGVDKSILDSIKLLVDLKCGDLNGLPIYTDQPSSS